MWWSLSTAFQEKKRKTKTLKIIFVYTCIPTSQQSSVTILQFCFTHPSHFQFMRSILLDMRLLFGDGVFNVYVSFNVAAIWSKWVNSGQFPAFVLWFDVIWPITISWYHKKRVRRSSLKNKDTKSENSCVFQSQSFGHLQLKSSLTSTQPSGNES